MRYVTGSRECFVLCGTSISSECMTQDDHCQANKNSRQLFLPSVRAQRMSSFIKSIQTSCACPCLPKALCSVMHFCCRSTQVSPPTLSTSRERGHLFSSAPLTSHAIISRGQIEQAKPRQDTSVTYPSAPTASTWPSSMSFARRSCQGSCKLIGV